MELGQINGARAVGRAMRLSPQDVPAHRVAADGVLVGPTANVQQHSSMKGGLQSQWSYRYEGLQLVHERDRSRSNEGAIMKKT